MSVFVATWEAWHEPAGVVIAVTTNAALAMKRCEESAECEVDWSICEGCWEGTPRRYNSLGQEFLGPRSFGSFGIREHQVEGE